MTFELEMRVLTEVKVKVRLVMIPMDEFKAETVATVMLEVVNEYDSEMASME